MNQIEYACLAPQVGRYQFGPESDPFRPLSTDWAQQLLEACPWYATRIVEQVQQGHVTRPSQSGEEVWGAAIESAMAREMNTPREAS